MNTYRVKARYEHPCGMLNATKVFNTPRGAINYLREYWDGYFCPADYRTIYNMRPSEFLTVKQDNTSISVQCYERPAEVSAGPAPGTPGVYVEEDYDGGE